MRASALSDFVCASAIANGIVRTTPFSVWGGWVWACGHGRKDRSRLLCFIVSRMSRTPFCGVGPPVMHRARGLRAMVAQPHSLPYPPSISLRSQLYRSPPHSRILPSSPYTVCCGASVQQSAGCVPDCVAFGQGGAHCHPGRARHGRHSGQENVKERKAGVFGECACVCVD